MSLEITCSACGAETLVRREPVFDGFKKTGEVWVCVSCGHRYASQAEVPFKEKKTAAIFTDSDKSRKVVVFGEGEGERNCRHCRHYVVNPFTQRCSLHRREVEATNVCGDFEKKPQLPGTPPQEKPREP